MRIVVVVEINRRVNVRVSARENELAFIGEQMRSWHAMDRFFGEIFKP